MCACVCERDRACKKRRACILSVDSMELYLIERENERERMM